MFTDTLQNSPCLMFPTADHLTQFHVQQLNDNDPSGPKDVNMRGRMIVGVNHESPPIDAKNRRHSAS